MSTFSDVGHMSATGRRSPPQDAIVSCGALQRF